MLATDQSNTFTLGDRSVKRFGYGAMQLAGPGVFGPPKDHDAALAVLAKPSRLESITSTPATTMAHT